MQLIDYDAASLMCKVANGIVPEFTQLKTTLKGLVNIKGKIELMI